MNSVRGIVVRLQDNGYKLISETNVKEFNLNLVEGRSWRICIDPATKFTGVALIDEFKEFVILLDFWRDKYLPKDVYEDELFFALKRIVCRKQVSHVVVEKPFTNRKFVRTSAELQSLQGAVKTWLRMIPELNEAEKHWVPVNTWKSYIINKEKGKGRFNQAGAIAEDLCDVIPALKKYKQGLNKGDLDSFDALGLLPGWEQHYFTVDGQAKIAGSKELSHKTFVGYLWLSEEDIDTEVQRILTRLMPVLGSPKALQFNERYDLLDNIAIASTENDFVVAVIPEKYLQQFQWKLEIDITEEKDLIAFIIRKGNVSVSNMRVISNMFELQEEVGGKV